MNTEDLISDYIASHPDPKRGEMQTLHDLVIRMLPGCRLWFLDGKNDEGKLVSNPNIGYGFYTIQYANGTSRDFYQIGLSANTSGISIYILGLEDKTYLKETYGKSLGKASITGYCIKFKSINDIDLQVLRAAIKYGAEAR